MYQSINPKNFEVYITEARNILIYGANISYHSKKYQSSLQNDEPVLEQILEHMHESCKEILGEGGVKFFGNEKTNIPRGVSLPPIGELGTLHGYHNVWKKMINDHCILATFDKLHHMIFHIISIKPYQLARHINYLGFNYAYDHDYFKISEGSDKPFIFNNDDDYCLYGAVNSVKASNDSYNSYPKSFKTLKKLFDKYPNYQYIGEQISLSKSGDKQEKFTIPLNSVPLLQSLRGNVPLLKNIFRLYDVTQNITPAKITQFIKSVAELQNIITKMPADDIENFMTRSDLIYYKYKLEQTFHFDFIYCLTKNIEALSKRHNLPFNDDTFIEFVSSGMNLPNTFSRHLLLQMAFDCCTDYRDFNSSFLIEKILKPDSMAYFDKRTNKITDSFDTLSQWKNCYRNFINYMVTFAFPIYESYFFVSLYDSFSKPEQSTAQNLLDLYKVLNKHLSESTTFNDVTEKTKYLMDKANDVCFPKKPNAKEEVQKPVQDNFILPDYPNTSIDYDILRKVILSTYNHQSKPMPVLISQEYLNENFRRLSESFIISCTAELLSR